MAKTGLEKKYSISEMMEKIKDTVESSIQGGKTELTENEFPTLTVLKTLRKKSLIWVN